jgi:undecaprenyl diphosphate synthase
MADTNKKKFSKSAKHIAIIMDGNGRWALANSLRISKGHSRGVNTVKEIVEESVHQNLSSLTLYAFSSENWSRPKAEIQAIKKLILLAIEEQALDLKKQKVKLKFFGRTKDFGKQILSKIEYVEELTDVNKPNLRLNIALGYGGRQDIVDITKDISKKVLSRDLNISDINENLISRFSSCPENEIDLLIRTGGDKRLSNFLLYQIAYTEICFVDKYWPDFSRKDFIHSLKKFRKVNRRFGNRV